MFQILFRPPRCEYIREALNDLRGIFSPPEQAGKANVGVRGGPASLLRDKKMGRALCPRLPRGSFGWGRRCWHLLIPQNSRSALPGSFSPRILSLLSPSRAHRRCRGCCTPGKPGREIPRVIPAGAENSLWDVENIPQCPASPAEAPRVLLEEPKHPLSSQGCPG